MEGDVAASTSVVKLEWLLFYMVSKYRQYVLSFHHKARVWQTDRWTELRLPKLNWNFTVTSFRNFPHLFNISFTSCVDFDHLQHWWGYRRFSIQKAHHYVKITWVPNDINKAYTFCIPRLQYELSVEREQFSSSAESLWKFINCLHLLFALD